MCLFVPKTWIFQFKSFSAIGFACIPRWIMFRFNMSLNMWFVLFIISTNITKPLAFWGLIKIWHDLVSIMSHAAWNFEVSFKTVSWPIKGLFILYFPIFLSILYMHNSFEVGLYCHSHFEIFSTNWTVVSWGVMFWFNMRPHIGRIFLKITTNVTVQWFAFSSIIFLDFVSSLMICNSCTFPNSCIDPYNRPTLNLQNAWNFEPILNFKKRMSFKTVSWPVLKDYLFFIFLSILYMCNSFKMGLHCVSHFEIFSTNWTVVSWGVMCWFNMRPHVWGMIRFKMTSVTVKFFAFPSIIFLDFVTSLIICNSCKFPNS